MWYIKIGEVMKLLDLIFKTETKDKETLTDDLIINSKNNNALTIQENKWIDENKYNVIDVALLNDIPVLMRAE